MVDLDTTATETVALLTHLLDQVDHTQPHVDELNQEFDTLSQQIDDDWQALADRIQKVLEQTNQFRDDLATEADEVNQLLRDLQERATELQTEAEAKLEETRSAIAALGENLTTTQPELTSGADATETALTSLQQATEQIRSTLTQTIATLQEHLRSEVSNDITSHEDAVNQQSSEFNSYLSDDCRTEIADQVTTFAQQVTDLLTELTDKLETVQSATADHADVSLKEVVENQRELYDSLLETGNEVMQTMTRIREAVQQAGRLFTTTKESLVTGAKTTNIATTTAIGLLEDVLSLLMI
ncbi:MAG: hypothetical protein NZ772_01495 [Cyanobacteria bacterium]|nr:hypothetical protein [Cyanobacteriota bacterium]MDW8199799.1 hypothetical protein [Cyanobacteriota bacterium SKYGB_h_bin112]